MSYKEDAILLAKAVLDNAQQFDDGDYSPKGHYCEFCWEGSWKSYEAVKHNLDCPTLVAKDILTGVTK